MSAANIDLIDLSDNSSNQVLAYYATLVHKGVFLTSASAPINTGTGGAASLSSQML